MCHNPAPNYDGAFIADVLDEIERARKKFPGTQHMAAVALEEAGEVAKAWLDHEVKDAPAQDVWDEAVQAAAMFMRWATEGQEGGKYHPRKIAEEQADTLNRFVNCTFSEAPVPLK